MSIRVAIVGPTGYTGLYLIQWLSRHPSARLTYLASARDELPDIAEVYPQLLGCLPDKVSMCRPIDAKQIAREADVVFLALPHVVAMQHAGELVDAGLRVIDLSADYRLADAELYERVYGHEHADKDHLAEAVYGLPELFRDDIIDAQLIANPGCYPTASALGISALLSRSLIKPSNIIVNAASGASGAGRGLKLGLHYVEHNESFLPYGEIGHHRHSPEIEQTLATVAGKAVPILFVPHLLPIDNGILASIYMDPIDDDVTEDDLFEALEDAYDDEPFVRIRTDLPNVKYVKGTNYCDLTVRLVDREGARKVVVFSTIDNMIKGASGQAIQNMNIAFGQDETAGLL